MTKSLDTGQVLRTWNSSFLQSGLHFGGKFIGEGLAKPGSRGPPSSKEDHEELACTSSIRPGQVCLLNTL